MLEVLDIRNIGGYIFTLTSLLLQDRSIMHHSMLRIGHSKHLPLPFDNTVQHNMLVRSLCSARSGHKLTYARVCSFILIFIEIPLLLRICPTSSKFDSLIRRVTTNYMRAGVYLIMSIIQWLSLTIYATSLIAAAVVLLVAAVFYALAGLKGQGFVGSKTLGGQGVAQMII